MIERHHDYILQVPSLPAGQSIVEFPLPIDTDAPFLARGVGLHVSPRPGALNQSDVRSMRFAYKNAVGADAQQIPIQTPQFFHSAFGQGGNYRPIYPQKPYPPGGNIVVSAYNDGIHDLTNLQIIFRGVKLYKDGQIPAPTYPSPCRPLEFLYQTGKGTADDAPIILNTTDVVRQIPLIIKADADFVCRAVQMGLWSQLGGNAGQYATSYVEVYVQLMDAQQQPYSNLPIHIDWIFGQANSINYSRELGNSAPGLIVPELYVPKSRALLFDLYRRDAPYVGDIGALPARFSMAWIGSKVYS